MKGVILVHELVSVRDWRNTSYLFIREAKTQRLLVNFVEVVCDVRVKKKSRFSNCSAILEQLLERDVCFGEDDRQ